MSKITEGLLENDLDDLVLPIISIDEYDSKVDNEAIVVAFYVLDQEPAEDLSYFIETGGYEILDSEVSPAPDENGNYLVFVEFVRNPEFPAHIIEILEGIENLVDVEEWSFTRYKGDGETLQVTQDELSSLIRTEPEKQPTVSEKDMQIYSFLKNSLLEGVNLSKNRIEFQNYGKSYVFEKIAFGDANLILHLLKLDSKPVELDSNSIAECNQLRAILGETWDVDKIGSHYVVTTVDRPQVMVLKERKK